MKLTLNLTRGDAQILLDALSDRAAQAARVGATSETVEKLRVLHAQIAQEVETAEHGRCAR